MVECDLLSFLKSSESSPISAARGLSGLCGTLSSRPGVPTRGEDAVVLAPRRAGGQLLCDLAHPVGLQRGHHERQHGRRMTAFRTSRPGPDPARGREPKACGPRPVSPRLHWTGVRPGMGMRGLLAEAALSSPDLAAALPGPKIASR